MGPRSPRVMAWFGLRPFPQQPFLHQRRRSCLGADNVLRALPRAQQCVSVRCPGRIRRRPAVVEGFCARGRAYSFWGPLRSATPFVSHFVSHFANPPPFNWGLRTRLTLHASPFRTLTAIPTLQLPYHPPDAVGF